MAKIKHTKTELKAQRESLSRFERFLPLLQLKKRQLQVEIRNIRAQMEEKRRQREALESEIESWVDLFSEDVGLDEIVRLERVETEEGNVAGVPIPVLREVVVSVSEYDLFSTPPWVDRGIEIVRQLIELKAALDALQVQLDRISDELRTTTQRVNLFEKVKIPECKENIRVIRIFLGDEQTAGVARAKIAKARTA